MRNFRLMVKMMVMALVFGAIFCSCNVAGGSDSYDSTASRASSLPASNAEGQGQPVAVTVRLPSVKVSITGPEMVEMHKTETATFTAKASEGAILSWYINGVETGETGTTYKLSLAQPGVYDITCVAISADYTMCKSASTYVVVNP